jgi:hydrogenase maturation protease
MSPKHAMVIGIGSHHGDDAIGWHVLEALREHTLPGCELVSVRTPVDALNHLHHLTDLHLVDACYGLNTGMIHRWLWPTEELAAYHWTTSHDLNVVGVLQLADQLGILPSRTVLWAIETDAFHPVTSISHALESAAKELVSQIREAIPHASDGRLLSRREQPSTSSMSKPTHTE